MIVVVGVVFTPLGAALRKVVRRSRSGNAGVEPICPLVAFVLEA